MKKTILLIISLSLLSLPFLAGAHAFGGSVEKQLTGGYADIGYSEPIPRTNKTLLFDFGLFTDSTKLTAADYDKAFVRINKGNDLIFAGTLPKLVTGAGMTYMFPSMGDFVVTVVYLKGSATVAETNFPLSVQAAESTEKSGNNFLTNPIVDLVAGLILGIAAQWLIGKFIKR